ncbi:hypothetical protein [Proteus mirabilis]|uniref:hypothetical protein n=1 Tax=Proteus mirabilis TaxID=584 RepID=UPI0034D42009
MERYGDRFESSTLFFDADVAEVHVKDHSGIYVTITDEVAKERLNFILDKLSEFTKEGFGYISVDKTPENQLFFKFSNENISSPNSEYRNLTLKRTNNGIELVKANDIHTLIDFNDLNIHNYSVRDHLGIQLSPDSDGIIITFVFMVNL